MTKLLLALLAGIVIAVPLSFAFLRRAGDGAAPPPIDAPVPPASADGGAALPSSPVDPATSEPAASGTGSRHPRASSAVTGRVLGPDGTPLAGAHVLLEILNDFSWKEDRNLVASSDAGGRFRLDVTGPRDLMVARLTVHVPGRLDQVRMLRSGALLADVELGDVAFEPGAELSGRLHCEGGLPDWGQWRILLATRGAFQDILPQRSASLPLASERGEFRIAGLPEGETGLLVYHPVLGVVSRTESVLRAGVDEPVVLDWNGPDPRTCIRVRIDADGPLAKGAVHLSGGELDRIGTGSDGRPNDFLFADVPDGTYEVTVKPRKKLLWSGSVSPGHVLEIDLRGKGIR